MSQNTPRGRYVCNSWTQADLKAAFRLTLDEGDVHVDVEVVRELEQEHLPRQGVHVRGLVLVVLPVVEHPPEGLAHYADHRDLECTSENLGRYGIRKSTERD